MKEAFRVSKMRIIQASTINLRRAGFKTGYGVVILQWLFLSM